MIKVVGYERKKGEFNGVPYDNMNLYTISNDLPSVTGYLPNTVKIKWNQLADIFHVSNVELPNVLNNLVNREVFIDFAYIGKYPKLVGIEFADNNEK